MFTALATMALLAVPALVAAAPGQAIVVNNCNYNVFLANTPSSDGVHTTDSRTLATGQNYKQTWTELANLAGWSIKLSMSATQWSSNIMQYEYTYQNDGIIWYDLSDVDGNPWDANWEITATSPSSTCSPLQQAYRYATDDAYGMQACSDDSTITVTLCSGNTAASVSSAAPVSSSAVAASSAASSTAVQTTTFATSAVATISAVTTNAAGSTTTNVKTATVTSVVTSTHWHHSHGARHATMA